jgi:hypothetical protein
VFCDDSIGLKDSGIGDNKSYVLGGDRVSHRGRTQLNFLDVI